MGILERAFARPEEERALSLTDYQQWIELGVVPGTSSGVIVSPDRALAMSAVYACVRILSETLASLPLIVYERLKRGKVRARDHYLYSLLKDSPNPMMTSFEFRETLQAHLALWGNAYAQIEYDNMGRPIELWPLRPNSILQIRDFDGERFYQYQLPDGSVEWIPGEMMWHLRGLGSDGKTGYSPIQLMREAVGLGMAAEEFGARFFANDATPGGVLEHPGSLSPEATQRLRESWEARHSGLTGAHKIAVLEEGLSYKDIGIPPEDAQFIETRRFQIQEIARVYRVPPHMLADLERATFSNIEHQSIEFVVHTMRPWLVRWEQSIQQNLMLERDRKKYFAEFLVDGLLRGDIASRYEAYSQARQNGWLSANEVRELENMNPIDGGDAYLIPLNMMQVNGRGEPIGKAEKRSAPVESRAAQHRQRLATAHYGIIKDVAGRIVRREVNDVMRAAKKMLSQRDGEEFGKWLDQFYADHKAFIKKHSTPVFRTYAEVVAADASDEVGGNADYARDLEAFVEKYVDVFADRYIGSSRAQIEKVIGDAVLAGEDPIEALQKRFGEWEERRPDKVALEESIRANNAVAKTIYALLGVLSLRWVNVGQSCPYCSSLDGQVISIREVFANIGDVLQPEGTEKPLTFSSAIGHPPAHPGCDCMVVAEYAPTQQEETGGR